MSEATQNLKMLEAAAVDPRVKMTAQMAIDEIERLRAALEDMKDVEAELRDDAQEWKTAYHNELEQNARLRAALWEIRDGHYHWLTTRIAKEVLE